MEIKLEAYQERVIEEARELTSKIDKLEQAAMNRIGGIENAAILGEQLSTMRRYRETLEMRIGRFFSRQST